VWTEAQVERLILAEVPTFSGRNYVEDWFDRHGIAHGYTRDTEGGGRGHQTLRDLAGLDAEDVSGVVFGSVEPPYANVDRFFHGRIDIVFFFDKRGRCVGHWVEAFTYEL